MHIDMIGSGFFLGKVQCDGFRAIGAPVIHIQERQDDTVLGIFRLAPVGVETACTGCGSCDMKIQVLWFFCPGENNTVFGCRYGLSDWGGYGSIACEGYIHVIPHEILLADGKRIVSFRELQGVNPLVVGLYRKLLLCFFCSSL